MLSRGDKIRKDVMFYGGLAAVLVGLFLGFYKAISIGAYESTGRFILWGLAAWFVSALVVVITINKDDNKVINSIGVPIYILNQLLAAVNFVLVIVGLFKALIAWPWWFVMIVVGLVLSSLADF